MSVRYQGVQKASAGYRLLASMGWKEGEGLGASKQGITEHIKVKKKFENWGVGAVRRWLLLVIVSVRMHCKDDVLCQDREAGRNESDYEHAIM